jgi:xanthine dehydrogenase accessory factor
VNDAGEFAGSVSSGCIEGDLHEHLRQILAGGQSRLLSYGITDEMAAEVGLACGGEIEVFADRYVADDPTWEALHEALERSRPAILMTGISGRLEGRRLLAAEGAAPIGTLESDLGGARLIERAKPLLDSGSTGILEVADGGESAAVLPSWASRCS